MAGLRIEIEGEEPKIGSYDKFVLVRYDEGELGYLADQEVQDGSAVTHQDIAEDMGDEYAVLGGGLAAIVEETLCLEGSSVTFGPPAEEKLRKVADGIAQGYEEKYGIEVSDVDIDLDIEEEDDDKGIDWTGESVLDSSRGHTTDIL